MDPKSVLSGFLVVLAATLNFSFFAGDIDRPELHSMYLLAAAVFANAAATAVKFGERTPTGALQLSASMVADAQLIAAAAIWIVAVPYGRAAMSASTSVLVVSLSGGALFANLVSVILLIIETVRAPLSRPPRPGDLP